MKRITNPLISRKEEAFLVGVAKRIHKFIHPDVATFLAIVSSVASFMLHIHADTNPSNYLWSCLAIATHYVWDGVDGKTALLRNLNRKRGWLIDKVSDYVCSCFFVAGFFYAVTKNIFTVVFLLHLVTIVHLIHAHLIVKRKIDVKLGGTESRIILVILNISAYLRAR